MWIAFAIELIGAVEVRALLHRPFAVVLDLAAPEDGLAGGIARRQFQPDVEGIHCAAGKEMADLAGAHHDIDADGRARLELHARRDRCGAATLPTSRSMTGARLLGLFADGECGGELRTVGAAPHLRLALGMSPRERRRRFDGDESGLQELLGFFELLLHPCSRAATAVLAAAKRCECTMPLRLPGSFDGDQRHVAIACRSTTCGG